jgi:hypothetical protein
MFVIARSDSDEAIRILARANWIASLTLAMTMPFGCQIVTTGHSRSKNGVASLRL